MKRILLVAMLLGSLPTFAQKTFEIYNYTGYTVDVADIITKPVSTTYAEIHSKPHGLISIPPGGSFILENTSNIYRFPYNSTVSTPFIPTWERLTGPATSTYITAAGAWALGTSQVFTRLLFYCNSTYNLISAASPTIPLQPGGWQADYIEDNPAPNVYYYTIVIY